MNKGNNVQKKASSRRRKSTTGNKKRVQTASSPSKQLSAGVSVASASAAQGTMTVSYKPQYSISNKGDITIERREFVMDVSGSAAFFLETFPINPGNQDLFPWLAAIAVNYERYRFEALEFLYVPACATTVTGSTVMSIDYDVTDSAPSSKAAMMQDLSSSSNSPWQPMCMKADVASANAIGPSRYTRLGGVPAGSDPKLYDIGNFYLANVGQAGSTLVGELHVKYKVRLMTPQQASAIGAAYSVKATGAGVTKSSCFGTSQTLVGTLEVEFPASNSVIFPVAGDYMLITSTTGTTLVAPALAGYGGTIAGNVTLGSSVVNSAGTIRTTVSFVRITAPWQGVTYDFSADATLATMILRVAPYNYTNL